MIRRQARLKTNKWYAMIPILFFFASAAIGFKVWGDSVGTNFGVLVAGALCIGSAITYRIGIHIK